MRRPRGLAILATALAVVGCASTNRVVFVTSTEIGVGMDATIGNVNIGYDRNELVVGPDYPETGGVPPVYAKLESDLKVLAPSVKQLYATGDAARLATQDSVPTPSPRPLTGKRRLLVFGTTTNVGLKVDFTAQQPTAINFGYKRKEFSHVPLREKDPIDEPDEYPSVIAGLSLRTSSSQLEKTGFVMSQFIATGDAAVNLAGRREVRDLFRNEATETLARAAVMSIEQVEPPLQDRMKPICQRQFQRGSDPTLDAQLAAIESRLGYTFGEACVHPSSERADELRNELSAEGLFP